MQERPFTFETDASTGRLVLHGDLDELAAIRLRDVLGELTDRLTRDLTVDLSDLDMLPSAAVGVLATAQDSARRQGAALTLIAADGTISARVLTICGIAHDAC